MLICLVSNLLVVILIRIVMIIMFEKELLTTHTHTNFNDVRFKALLVFQFILVCL